MLLVGRYRFKRATSPREFEEIHRLNYRTFVGEIGQHADTGAGRLVDKFHDKNLYFVALRDEQVVGMISAHDQAPFSIAGRLSEPGILTKDGARPIEVRLLAVEPDERNGTVLMGLLWSLFRYARDSGYSHMVISAVEERGPLYKRLGFEPLGPAVPCGSAAFVPMRASLREMQITLQRVIRLWQKHMAKVTPTRREAQAASEPPSDLEEVAEEAGGPRSVCLLPGPVTTSPLVRDAFRQPAIYHRGAEFINQFERVRRQLGDLAGGRDVALINGSGTLANEAVAATIAAEFAGNSRQRGLLLVNGEFGQRLARQAARFGLHPRILAWPWGKPWDLQEVAVSLEEDPGWVWGVHQESSTGVLNDLSGLTALCQKRGVRVCVDCVSSLGAVPLDLRNVYLASGATGKALGSYAGASIVFADAAALAGLDLSRVPSYLDVPAHLAMRGPRFTFPSPVLRALQAALSLYGTPEQAQARYHLYGEMGAHVRGELRRLKIQPLADDTCASPVVTTFAPPGDESAEAFGARCRSWGFIIGGQSGYLAERRLVQIATMGAVTRDDVAPLFEHLSRWLNRSTTLAG